MSFASVPAAERVHIAFFGRRNAGKSSLINAITNQNISIVSDVKGTTTDPVSKTMEMLPIGPVVIIDTPGIDDVGELGEMRVKRAYDVLDRTDVCVVVIDSTSGISDVDKDFISMLDDRKKPYIICYNKCDLSLACEIEKNAVCVSAATGKNIDELKNRIAKLASIKTTKYIIRNNITSGDIIVLVIPIDSGAPKGRIILPQQAVLREVLDAGGVAVCVQPNELQNFLKNLSVKPKLVITDSQVFSLVADIVSDDILLTSFSILFMNYKGELKSSLDSVARLGLLKDNDCILIAEGCTHHKQCDDIGTVKIPEMIKKHTSANVRFEFQSGRDYPEDLSKYSLIIQCGGCMLTEAEMQERIKRAKEFGVPITNYGIVFAYYSGVLSRSVEFLKKW